MVIQSKPKTMPKPSKITLKQRLTKDTSESKPSIFISYPNGINRLCPICCKSFNTDLAYQTHVRKHSPQCPYCDLKLNSWNEWNDHMKCCSRKYGVIKCPQRPSPPKPVPTPFKCCLCKRRYQTEQQMITHQIERCKKRYLTDAWIVKIWVILWSCSVIHYTSTASNTLFDTKNKTRVQFVPIKLRYN